MVADAPTRRVQAIVLRAAAEAYGATRSTGPVCKRCGFQDEDVDPDCQGECEVKR